MELIIHLVNNKGYIWKIGNKIYYKGYSDGEENFLKIIQTETKLESIINIVKKLNGFFGLIRETEDLIIAFVDRVRSIPLFYHYSNDKFIITDNVDWLIRKLSLSKTDELSEYEFLFTGYVTKSDTLFKEVKQIQPGEVLCFNKKENILRFINYFEFSYRDGSIILNLNKNELLQKLDDLHLDVFKRLVKSLKGQPAIIPLSGGHDSRLVAIMLKRLEYPNVICFTYGKKGNSEVTVAKKLAKLLGYSWIYIEYSRKKWYNWYNDKLKSEFIIYGGNYCSIAHFQDWAAVMELKKNKQIPNNSIFIPGHSGDFTAGSHIPKKFWKENDKIELSEVGESILSKHYYLWKSSSSSLKESILAKKFNPEMHNSILTNVASASLFENWDWRERQSKFIVNSVRVYEFFDYQWRLPLWDVALIEFWLNLDFKYRIGRNFYKYYAQKYQGNYQIPVNPNRNIFLKVIDYVTDSLYGRINGDKPLLIAILEKTAKKIPMIRNYKLKYSFIFFEKKPGLNSIINLFEIKRIINRQN